jgi:hypothetical protein
MTTTTVGAYSISFMDMNFRNYLPVKGMEVDYKKGATWIRGIVDIVTATSDGAHLKVRNPDDKTNIIETLYWPSDNVDFCGEHVENKNCPAQS